MVLGYNRVQSTLMYPASHSTLPFPPNFAYFIFSILFFYPYKSVRRNLNCRVHSGLLHAVLFCLFRLLLPIFTIFIIIILIVLQYFKSTLMYPASHSTLPIPPTFAYFILSILFSIILLVRGEETLIAEYTRVYFTPFFFAFIFLLYHCLFIITVI